MPTPIKHPFAFSAACLGFVGITSLAGSAPSAALDQGPPPAESGGAVRPSNPTGELTVRFLHALRDEPGNIFFSAVSLRGALGMSALGAKGRTLAEMAGALLLDPDPSRNASEAKAEGAGWRRAAGMAELAIANRLWVERAYRLNPTFLEQCQAGYGASAALLDFSHSPEPSRAIINQWVSSKTRGHIGDSLPAGSIDASTRLVITNAIYFKGRWAQAFDPKNTAPGTFTTEQGEVTAPMMHKKMKIGFFQDEVVQVGTLGYQRSNLEMIVLLPKSGQTLSTFESKLTAERLQAWACAGGESEVVVTLPKFGFEWGRSVAGELRALGMQTAFSPAADFSALSVSGGPPLYVSDVFHKTFVVVDEAGTEAAAVTHQGMKLLSERVPPEFTVDHPFLFFIHNQITGDWLFAGRVTNPTGEKPRAASNARTAPTSVKVFRAQRPKIAPGDLSEWMRQLNWSE